MPKQKTDKAVEKKIADKIHKRIVDSVLSRQRKKAAQTAKVKRMGRPPIPAEERRDKNRVSVYLNDTELQIVRSLAAGGSVSDLLRTMIVTTAEEMKKREAA
jgi:hypothetical protein